MKRLNYFQTFDELGENTFRSYVLTVKYFLSSVTTNHTVYFPAYSISDCSHICLHSNDQWKKTLITGCVCAEEHGKTLYSGIHSNSWIILSWIISTKNVLWFSPHYYQHPKTFHLVFCSPLDMAFSYSKWALPKRSALPSNYTVIYNHTPIQWLPVFCNIWTWSPHSLHCLKAVRSILSTPKLCMKCLELFQPCSHQISKGVRTQSSLLFHWQYRFPNVKSSLARRQYITYYQSRDTGKSTFNVSFFNSIL